MSKVPKKKSSFINLSNYSSSFNNHPSSDEYDSALNTFWFSKQIATMEPFDDYSTTISNTKTADEVQVIYYDENVDCESLDHQIIDAMFYQI